MINNTMRFEELVLIYEDAASEYQRSFKLLSKTQDNAEELLNKIVEVTERNIKTNQNRKIFTNFQNNKKLYKLTELLIDSGNIEVFSDVLNEYLSSELSITDPIERFKTFIDFENKVHSSRKEVYTKKDISDLKVYYEDEFIKVYLGEDPETCRLLGSHHNYCISTDQRLMYFRQYRFKNHQSTYFVYFKTQPKKTPINNDEKLILIDALDEDDEEYTWNPTDRSGQHDYNISKKELLKKFPELKKAFDKDVFVFQPFTEKEKVIYGIVYDAKHVLDLKNPEHIILNI